MAQTPGRQSIDICDEIYGKAPPSSRLGLGGIMCSFLSCSYVPTIISRIPTTTATVRPTERLPAGITALYHIDSSVNICVSMCLEGMYYSTVNNMIINAYVNR